MKKNKFKPLIKYTGGKFNEYKYFNKNIPLLIKDYYEPFFGGGGVLFQLCNDDKIKGKIFINDKSTDLMSFYSNICDETFIKEIRNLSNVWDDVRELSENINKKYNECFFNIILKNDDIDISDFINRSLHDYINESISETKYLAKYNIHGLSLSNEIYKGLESKTKRFIKKDIAENEVNLAHKSITTAVCQSFYFIIRNMYNKWNSSVDTEYTRQEKSAQWFFIREFCFGSMFRFSKNGNFNIPYGGFAYNKKCFKCKVDQITSESIQSLFKRINISAEDFSLALDKKFNEDDFIFLDPPYDSIFSEYDNNTFDKEDHKRLKNYLSKIKCKWLIVIRKTDFISELYCEYKQEEFDKIYTYQAKGEYEDKNSKHLIIKNF